MSNPAPDPAPRRRWSAETAAIAAVGATLLLALFALLAPLRSDMAEVRRDLHALSERVARIEGALTGPYRLPATVTAPAPDAPAR